MANRDQNTSDPARRRSDDRGGLGQSGYTAGRRENDPALERGLEAKNSSYRRDGDAAELLSELGTDDRFTGRGGGPPGDDERVERVGGTEPSDAKPVSGREPEGEDR